MNFPEEHAPKHMASPKRVWREIRSRVGRALSDSLLSKKQRTHR